MDTKWSNRARILLAWIGALAGIAYIALFTGGNSGPAGAAKANAALLPEEDLTVFVDRLESGWQDWSWATRQIPDPTMKYANLPSIRLEPGGWKGLFFHHDVFSTTGYKALTFFIHGGERGGQKLAVCAVDAANKFGPKIDVTEGLSSRTVPAGKFDVCVIPLEKLGAANTRISGICFQDSSGQAQAPVYLANIRLTAAHKRVVPDVIALTVNAGQEIGSISPYIYGMAQPGPEHLRQLRLKVWRWGGNPATRYNWEKGNCWNAARDWHFRNGNYSHTSPADRQPSGVADQAIALGREAGSDVLVTIPTIGWVARDDDQRHASVGVPDKSGSPVAPGSEAIAGYDPTVNRQLVSMRSLPRKGSAFSDPPNLTDDVVYQDEWIYHLTRRFGKASAGGVRFYAMDNEPDLWDSTHTDMHPVRPDYDEIRDTFLNCATAVKDVDSSAQIMGPVSWGWTGYWFSPRDRGDDNYHSAPDRAAHGNMPFLPWFLQQVAVHDKKAGRRTLDYLDVHYYPQANGVYGGRKDPQTNALRLRSVRSLWDPEYSDESWIGTQVQLLPRLRQWVNKYYPGTKIALNEWNFGADNTLNGGLAVAEALGVLGREQIDMACYWAVPGVGSPGFYAYKMYRNADDAGHGFGDKAVAAASNDPQDVSCYGSVDSQTGQPVILLINKMPEHTATIRLTITGGKGSRGASVYRYSNEDLKTIAHLPDIAIGQGAIPLSLPGYSITLLRCHP